MFQSGDEVYKLIADDSTGIISGSVYIVSQVRDNVVILEDDSEFTIEGEILHEEDYSLRRLNTSKVLVPVTKTSFRLLKANYPDILWENPILDRNTITLEAMEIYPPVDYSPALHSKVYTVDFRVPSKVSSFNWYNTMEHNELKRNGLVFLTYEDAKEFAIKLTNNIHKALELNKKFITNV